MSEEYRFFETRDKTVKRLKELRDKIRDILIMPSAFHPFCDYYIKCNECGARHLCEYYGCFRQILYVADALLGVLIRETECYYDPLAIKMEELKKGEKHESNL